MKTCALLQIGLIFFLSTISCSGPQISIEEENVLSALSNIQQSLENNVSYEAFIELVDQVKTDIDMLKRNGNNNMCFLGAVDKCYAFYHTAGKAWRQKMDTMDEVRKNDMDLTLSVLQSRAALSIQFASNCYED
jgi:hypothetical protein